MFGFQSINYIARVYNPVIENKQSSKFRFDVCFRSDLIFTDGKLYDSVIDCTSAMCLFLNKLSEYEDNNFNHPIVLSDFNFINYEQDSKIGD